jgi:hypothetical protein
MMFNDRVFSITIVDLRVLEEQETCELSCHKLFKEDLTCVVGWLMCSCLWLEAVMSKGNFDGAVTFPFLVVAKIYLCCERFSTL